MIINVNLNDKATKYMLLAVSSIALSSFFAKLCLNEISVYKTLFLRFVIPLIIIFFIYAVLGILNKLSCKNFKNHVIRSVFLTLSQLFLLYSMLKLPLSEASALYNTGPIFMVFLLFIFGYKINLHCIGGVLIGLIGVLLICHLQNSVINYNVFYALLSGISYAISQLSFHKASFENESINTLFFTYLLTTIFSVILFFCFDEKTFDLYVFDDNTIIFIFLIGLFSLSNQFFRCKAYSIAENPSSLAPLVYLSSKKGKTATKIIK